MQMKFSVITVCFNDCEGIEKTVRSVVEQTCSDYEYIVIDGGSTDGSVDVIEKYKHNIHYWISEKDNGVYAAMNKAIKVAKGDYCIFMNSGDSFFSNDVLEKVESLNLNCDLVVGGACMIREEKRLSFVLPPKSVSVGFWLYHSVIHQAAFMRTAYLKEKFYDESFKIVADWKYMISEYLSRRYIYQSIPFTICCFDTTGMSSNEKRRNAEREKALKEVLPPMIYDDYKKYAGLKPLYSNDTLLNSLNEVCKYRTLVRLLSKGLSVILKLYTRLKQ